MTLREASSCAAMAEAYCTILRGHADAIVVGATGTRIHPFRTLHALTQEPLASERTDPTTMSRPFDADRDGAVVGEGSAALILEEYEHAQARGATIWGEVAGFGSAAVGSSYGPDFQRRAIKLVATQALRSAKPTDVGHINAHGISTLDGDMHEAQGLADVFGEPAQQPPTVAAKSYFGNLGAAGGMVELICSLLALKHGSLFRTLNHLQSDPRCPVRVNTTDGASPGDSFLKVSVTPQGQASAIYVRRV